EAFDLGLVLPNSFRSAFELWWAGIPVRIGYGTQLRRPLLTRPVPPRKESVPMRKRTKREVLDLQSRNQVPMPGAILPSSHHIYQYLHLTATLGARLEPV